MMEERWRSRGLCSNISTGEVLCRGLGCVPREKSKRCQKLLEPAVSRARGKRHRACVPSRQEVKTHNRDGLLGNERPDAQQFSN